MKRRCPWGEQTASMKHYHDTVWGVPEYDDQLLFRKLMLDKLRADQKGFVKIAPHALKNFHFSLCSFFPRLLFPFTKPVLSTITYIMQFNELSKIISIN